MGHSQLDSTSILYQQILITERRTECSKNFFKVGLKIDDRYFFLFSIDYFHVVFFNTPPAALNFDL